MPVAINAENFECICPVIADFCRTFNDKLPSDRGTELLNPLIADVMNTRVSEEVEARRRMLCVDWLVRVYVPTWLKLAGLTEQATTLEWAAEITDVAQLETLEPTFAALSKRHDGLVSRCGPLEDLITRPLNGVWDRAWRAGEASGRSAAMYVAWILLIPLDSFRTAIFNAERLAVEDANADAVNAVVARLQQSAVDLLKYMISRPYL